MDVCLMTEGQQGVTWDQWLALALACEEHGIPALFRSDHYLSMGQPGEEGALDAWATLSALGARTERVRLGTMVSPVTFRHPAELAKAVATADHASEGRVELGMGAGWFEAEHTAYGFPFPPVAERMQMLEEQTEIVHRSLSHDEKAFTFEGRHYTLRDCPALPKPVQKPHPPLIIGGEAGPLSTRIAARWADGYNVNFVAPPECTQARARVDRACEALGRDPGEVPLSLMTGSLVGADEDELMDRAKRLMDRRGQTGDAKAYLDGLGDAWLVGTPKTILERLAALSEAGVRRVMFQHLLHDDLDAVALIGSALVPEAATL